MLNITNRILRVWGDAIGITDLKLVEHDYRITYLLDAIYSDRFLSQKLLLKGGTAINKLYLGRLNRLSVDLDFNQIGSKEDVLRNAERVRKAIIEILRKQDRSYDTNYNHRWEQTTIHTRYNALSGSALQPLKIEISHIERFPIMGAKTKKMALHDSGNTAKIITLTLEELLATKLRALYDRLKGRDVYDLYQVYPLKNKTALRKMFLYYFYRDRKVFNPRIYFKKVSESDYEDDVSGFIRPSIEFDLQTAKKAVIRNYNFLRDIDTRDKKFLSLARLLLGQPTQKKLEKEIMSIRYPFRVLFGDNSEMNKSILDVKTEEIKLFDSN